MLLDGERNVLVKSGSNPQFELPVFSTPNAEALANLTDTEPRLEPVPNTTHYGWSPPSSCAELATTIRFSMWRASLDPKVLEHLQGGGGHPRRLSRT